MNTRLNNGEHFRLLDGREFHLCGRVDTKRVGRVVMDGGLITVSIDEKIRIELWAVSPSECRGCPLLEFGPNGCPMPLSVKAREGKEDHLLQFAEECGRFPVHFGR